MTGIPEAIEAVWRNESTRLIAAIARVTHDVGLAEELAQDTLVLALERWPTEGIPSNPGAWLMLAAKRRAIDLFRRDKMLALKHGEITRDLEAQQQQLGHALEQSMDQVIDDDILRLIFTACHPVVPIEGRIALTLRMIGGLTTPEIARAFLVPEKTLAQRIVRAKRTIADAHIPFETPRGAELATRISSVLTVLYLIFNEGHTATSGDNWFRASLTAEALRLARLLTHLLPREPEAHALLALMELNSARNAARTTPDGRAILLPDQDRTLWDQAAIDRGLAALAQAQKLGDAHEPYALQAAIAACHMRASSSEATDWHAIVRLYDTLLAQNPSPVIALNRAVALGMAAGPAAGLAALDIIAHDPALAGYHLVPSVRADFLLKLNRPTEARTELQRALALTSNKREQDLLTDRLNALAL